jgi:peroxiredoxin
LKKVDKPFKLSGKLKNGAGSLIVLNELSTLKILILDSVRCDAQGNFNFEINAPKTSIGFLTINRFDPPGVPIAMTNGEKLSLEMEESKIILTNVKGDKQNLELKRLYDVYTSHNLKNVEFNEKYGNLDPRTMTDSMKNAINLGYTSLQQQNEVEIWNFIKNAPASIATYFAATFILEKPQPQMLNDALEKLQKSMPEADFTQELEARLNRAKPLEVGGLVPDIALKNPKGEVVKLSSLQGKVVLIDFWASWCRPCRMENPNVVKMYEKYHKKGFEIYGVSLDKNAQQWEGAIAQDGLTWIHVSDLQGWSSSAAQLYKVSSIPNTFLVDKKGRLIAANLRGPSLENKLAEIFD